MTEQKDRHLEAPGEANRDKHINFVAEENGDVDPADDDSNNEEDTDESGDDNGFFTDDDNKLQTQEEFENDKSNRSAKDEKASPLSWDDSETLADKITVNADNEDILTPVVDDDKTSSTNEDDQAH